MSRLSFYLRLLAGGVFAVAGQAQNWTGTVEGVTCVESSSIDCPAGALVTLRPNGGRAQTRPANSGGRFRFEGLPPGRDAYVTAKLRDPQDPSVVLFFGDARTEVIHATGTSELLTPPLLMKPNQPSGPPTSQSRAPWPQQPTLLLVTLHRVEAPRWSDWSDPEPQQPSPPPPTIELVLTGPAGPVANAELTLIDDDSGEQIARALSDAAGRVTINVPASGSWTAMVDAAGFLPRALMVVSKTGVVLWAAPGQPLGRSAAITMLPDKTAEVSLVSLASRGTSRRVDILAQAIEQLPLAMVRSVDAFALLAPGVAPPPETYGRTGPGIGPGIGTAGQFSVNGLRSRDNNFTIDGADNNDEDTGVRRQAYLVPVAQAIESLETFQITTAAPDARFGRATAGQVNIVSRYGASRLHGRAFGFLSDRRWNARDYFSAAGVSVASPLTWRGQPVRLALDGVRAPGLSASANGSALVDAAPSGEPPSMRIQSGLALGGPAGRRSFWFATYERTHERKQRDLHFAAPTFDDRTLARLTPAPLLSTTFPVSLPGNAILSLVPYPNNPAGPYGANTFTTRSPSDGTGDVYSGKFDRALGRQWSNNLSVRYNATRETAALPAIGGAIDSAMRSRSTTQNVVASWNFLPLRSLTNNLRFAFGRTATSFDDLSSGRLSSSGLFPNERMLLNAPMLLNLSTRAGGPLLASALSRPGRDSYLNAIQRAGDTERFLGAIGELRIAGYSPIGVDSYRFPQQRDQRTYQISEQAAWTRGRNTLYFGFDVRRLRLSTAQARNTRPLLAFHGLRNALTGASADPILAIEAAAAVVPAGMMQTIGLDSDNSLRLRRTTVDLYAHNELRISRRVLLTAGLRVEFNRLPKDLDDKLSTAFTPDRFRAEVEKARPACGSDLVGQRCQQLIASVDRQLNRDLGTVFGADRVGNDPRVGFAWDLAGNGRTVLRAAAGVYTAQFPAIVVNESRSVFPSYAPLNLSRPASLTEGRVFLPNIASEASAALRKPGTLATLAANNPDAPNLLAMIANELQLVLRFGNFVSILPGGDPILVPTQPAERLKNPYAFHYHATLEHRLARSLNLSTAYVATRGTRLLREWTPNGGAFRPSFNAQFVAPLPGTQFSELIGLLTSITANPNDLPVRSTLLEGTAQSIYHALQSQLTWRPSKGPQVSSGWTWSRAIDDASDVFETSGSPALAQNSRNRQERADSSFDTRLRQVTYWTWDVPWRSKARWFAGIGWSGIFTTQTGQPFTVNTTIDWNADGNLTDRLNSTEGLVRGPVDGDRRRSLSLTRPSAELLAAPRQANRPVFSDGAVGRNTFRAPGILTLDTALSTGLYQAERWTLRLRAEAFNIANRPHFATPVRWLEAPGFGSSAATSVPNRTMQLSLRAEF